MNPAPIKLLILDVDGVLTDGRLVMSPEGEAGKAFCVQDGCAVKLWREGGGRIAILSGRRDACLRHRAAELAIEWVHTGVMDKLAGYEKILIDAGCHDEVVCYVGDDLPDLGPMSRCGFPVAVANALPNVKRIAHYVTRRRGGEGAVAEVVEHLLRKQHCRPEGLIRGT